MKHVRFVLCGLFVLSLFAAGAIGASDDQDQGYTLFLDVDGHMISVAMQGTPESYTLEPRSGTRIRRFTLDDARVIRAAMLEQGFSQDDVLRVLFDVELPSQSRADSRGVDRRDRVRSGRYGFSTTSESARVFEEQTILDPDCGQCLNGNECIDPDGFIDCCTAGGRSCSKCKTCG